MKNVFVLVAVAVLFAAGCNSPSKYAIDVRTISLDSDPSGANVYLINPVTDEKTLLGTTPLSKQPVPVFTAVKERVGWADVDKVMSQLGAVRVAVMKPGFRPVVTNLNTDPNKVTYHKVTLTKQ